MNFSCFALQSTGQHAGGVSAGAADGSDEAARRCSGSSQNVSGAGQPVRSVTLQPANGARAVPTRRV